MESARSIAATAAQSSPACGPIRPAGNAPLEFAGKSDNSPFMIGAFLKAVQQLGDKNTRKPLWIGIGLAIGVFVVLWISAGFVIRHTALFEIPWLETISDTLSGALVLVLTWVLFPGVVSAVVALFLDQVAESVEQRHYPSLAPAGGQPMGEQVSMAAKFLGLVVLLNLMLLPFMLLGPAYPVLFYAVNGYLLGREYFEMVAARRLGLRDVILLRRAHSGQLFLAGVATALLLTVPLVNLLTPVIATAAMVHLFQTWRPADMTEGRSVQTAETSADDRDLASRTVGRGGNSVLDGTRPDA